MPLQKEKEAATFCVISWILMLILLPCSISRFGVKTARFQTPLPLPSSSNLRRKCQNQPQQLKPVRNLFSEVRAVSCMLCCAACLFRFEAISTTARNVCFNLFPKGIPHSTPCKEVEFSKFPWIFSPTHCPLQFCFNFTKRYCFFKIFNIISWSFPLRPSISDPLAKLPSNDLIIFATSLSSPYLNPSIMGVSKYGSPFFSFFSWSTNSIYSGIEISY